MEGERQGVLAKWPVGLLQPQGLWGSALRVAELGPERSHRVVMGVGRSGHEEVAQLRQSPPPQAPAGPSAPPSSLFLCHWAQNTELWPLSCGTAGSWA